MKKVRSNKGFTLVELIIVIAILAIIMLIAIPNFSGIQHRMQVRADKSTAANIAKAVRIWYTEYNSDPSFKALVDTTVGDGTVAVGTGNTEGNNEEGLPAAFTRTDSPLTAPKFVAKIPTNSAADTALVHLCQVPKLVSYVDTTLVPSSLQKDAAGTIEPDQFYYVGITGSGVGEKVVIAIANSTAPEFDGNALTQANVLYNGAVATDISSSIAYMEP